MSSLPRWLMIASVVAVLLVLAGGAWFYHVHERHHRKEAESTLQAIGQMKVDQIAEWRAERLADAILSVGSPVLVEALTQWMADPQPQTTEQILPWLRAMQEHNHYYDVLLVDAKGQVRLSLTGRDASLHEEALQTLTDAFGRRQPMLTELHEGPGDLPPHLDVVAPFFSARAPEAEPAGAIILVVDARRFLYPLMQSWPTPSRSAETLLVRRDGDTVLYLNDLRHRKDTAFKLRIPLTQTDVPAVQAVLGEEGVFEGKDYRGNQVFSVLKPIPDSPWFLVSKIDVEEALAVWRLRSVLIVGTLLAMVVSLSAVVGLFRQREEKAHYRSLYHSEASRREAMERYRVTLLSVGDGVIVTDRNGRVELMNPVAESLTGYGLEEAGGKPLEEVFRIVNEITGETVQDPVQRVIREGLVVGLANHTVLLARDGTVRPIADSGAPIRDHNGVITGVVLVVRDQTEARSAQKAVRDNEQRLTHLLSVTPCVIFSLIPDGPVATWISPNIEAFLGFTVEEALQPGWWDNHVHPDDRDHALATIPVVLAENRGTCEYRFHNKNGDLVWLHDELRLQRDEQGNPVEIVGAWTDITERKRAEEAIRAGEARYRDLWEKAPAMMISVDSEARIRFVSDRFCEELEYERQEILGRRPFEFQTAASAHYAHSVVFPTFMREGFIKDAPLQFVKKSGQVMDVLLSVTAERDADGGIVRSRSAFVDITERKRAEEALFEQGRLLREMSALAHIGAWSFDPATGRGAWTEETANIHEVDPDQEIDADFGESFFHGDDRRKIEAAIREAMEFRTPYDLELEMVTGKGNRKWVRTIGSPVCEGDRVVRLRGTIQDITDRKRAEAILRESEARFRRLFEQAPAPYQSLDAEGRILDVNHAWLAELGYDRHEVIGKWFGDFLADHGPQVFRERFAQFKERGGVHGVEFEMRRKNGSTLIASFDGRIAQDEKGEFLQTHCVFTNITARVEAEAERARLESAIAQTGEMVVVTDAQGTVLYVNPAFERITGYTREEAVGRTPRLLNSGQQDRRFYAQLWSTIKGGNVWSGRMINRKKDGTLFHEDSTISPVKDRSGQITNYVAVKRDITEHLELSKQLVQSQKMEAVGTLAGGVAHDFNNLLAVVLGFSELMLSDEGFPSRYRDDLEKVYRAADSGADLVRRLLAFSRKADATPSPRNLNTQISQLNSMLARVLPKMIQIELSLADDLETIDADHTQIEQVVMNLAVNARDAMPNGGRLIIETRNVTLGEDYGKTHVDAKPGPYVQLSVTDTGRGMDKETMQHIFEPFFTTKGPGEGTGLGLAMVYGIVKQHGGHIMCYSEPGAGTTFKVYFPALRAAGGAPPSETKPEPRGGTETVLLVDDEEMIRDLASRILTRAGYEVITACNGKEALETYQARRDEISLVILDLIMPEMGGRECLEMLLSLDHDVRVVIASGYSADGSAKDTLSAGARGFLRKPYEVRQVLDVVRAAIDHGRSGPQGVDA
ncbi:MAG: PAS domain S-box protein [Thermodesulfobacteriota bacterium]